MTSAPNPGQKPEPSGPELQRRPGRSHRRSRVIWMRAGLGMTVTVLLGGAAGAWWLLNFIYRDMVPLIEENLSQVLDRPVDLGDVEGFSLNGLVFGRSELPPTPTDLDRGTVERVEIQFNPLDVIFTRRLVLDITLIGVDVFLDENAEGQWITTEIQEGDEEGPIRTEVSELSVVDSSLTLAPSVERREEAGALPLAPGQPPPLITLRDINGQVNFFDNNERIAFEAALNPETGGTLQLQGESIPNQGDTTLSIQGSGIEGRTLLELAPVPVTATEGQVFANTTLQFRNYELDSIDGTARLQNVTVLIAEVPQEVSQISGQLRFQGKQIRLEDGRATYGTIPVRGSGTIHLEDGFNLTAQLRSIPTSDLERTFDFEFPIPVVGGFNADATITGPFDQPLISGVITNSRPTRIDRILFDDLRAEGRLQNERLFIDSLTAIPTVGGQLTGSGELTVGENGTIALEGQVRGLPGDAIARLYGANLENFRVGPVGATVAVTGSANQPQTQIRWQAPGASFPAQGEVAIVGEQIQFRNTSVQVAGTTLEGSGEIFQGQWQAQVQGNGLQLAQFTPQFPGVASGTVRASGSLDDFAPETIRATGDVTVRVAGGTLNADASLDQGRWQADIRSQGVQLQAFSDQLTGELTGNLQASGNIRDFSAGGIQASGRASLSNPPFLNRPTTAALRWTGDRLFLDEVVARDFRASGVIVPQLEGPGAPAIANLDFNVAASNVDLAALPVALPPQVRVQGLAGFDGRISGSPNNLLMAGQVRLDQFVFNDIAFEPVLRGPVNFATGQGFGINLSGQQDQIAVQIDAQNRPVAFRIRQQEVLAEGQTEGDRLTASLVNFPLEILNLTPAADFGLGAVGGNLSGNLVVNLETYAAAGNIVVARPSLDHIRADRFATSFRYGDNQLNLSEGELIFGSTRLLIDGNGIVGDNANFQAKIVAEQGNVQDVLRLMQWFDLADLGRGIASPQFGQASDVETVPVGEPTAPLIDQLRRFSEILALQSIQQAEQLEAQRLPPLRELQGNFAGEVALNFTQQDGLALDFDLQGENWLWGDYRAEQVVARGELNDGVVTLLPLSLQTDEMLVTLTGNFGGDEQSGQFQARNVPIAPLRELLRLPLEIEGRINANALLEGSVGNPSVRGELTFLDTTINQNTIQGATAQFSFNDARLNFISRLIVTEDQPVVTVGSIPQSFPFMNVEPDSNAITLSLNVEDEGLSIINLLNDQVTWEGGEGSVRLDVTGTLDAPIINGSAELRGAEFSAVALPEPLRNVNANIQFNGRVIEVQQFEGQFEQGQVVAQGTLPVFDEQDLTVRPVLEMSEAGVTTTGPLTVRLNQVELNFRGLFRGRVEGQVAVEGTALAPRLGGQIVVSNGRVELPTNPQAPPAAPVETAPGDMTAPPQFENLLITLGDRLQITLDPILNFVVRGDLELNGPLATLRPSGEIQVSSGQVNIFTTQFSLDRRFNNTVEFRPDRGLDPIINARLITTVPEVTRSPVLEASLFPSAEITEPLATDFGILNTVRIQAEATGPASQLFNNLQLTSSPSRSRREIIALLGGGFVDNLGQGDATAAIANLAGSALLTGVQNIISNALGLTDFRLFPTQIPSETGATSTLGLASEIGVDITQNISVSLLQILTAESPTQFNLRYRVNDQFLLRGFIDTDGGNGVQIEFSTRF